MNHSSIEAQLLALDAAVRALASTHSDPSAALNKFQNGYQEKVKALNKSGFANLASELTNECRRIEHYFQG